MPVAGNSGTKVPGGSGRFQKAFEFIPEVPARFRKVPEGSGRFRRKDLNWFQRFRQGSARFRKVPGGSGKHLHWFQRFRQGSGRFRKGSRGSGKVPRRSEKVPEDSRKHLNWFQRFRLTFGRFRKSSGELLKMVPQVPARFRRGSGKHVNWSRGSGQVPEGSEK